MIKAIFFDFDGTLYSHATKHIPAGTLHALEALRSRGIRLFLATGRNTHELHKLASILPPMDGYVLINGQLCLDDREAPLMDLPIPELDLQVLLRAFATKEYPMLLVQQHGMYGNLVNDAVLRVQADISSPLPPIAEYAGGPVYQVVVYDDGSRLRPLMDRLTQCKLTRWNPGAVDIIGAAGGKVTGIRYFLERNGWRPEEVMAFGDGDNDMDMLRFAGIGVAMGNAAPEVQAQADFVTTDIDADGIAKALAHFGLV